MPARPRLTPFLGVLEPLTRLGPWGGVGSKRLSVMLSIPVYAMHFDHSRHGVFFPLTQLSQGKEGSIGTQFNLLVGMIAHLCRLAHDCVIVLKAP